MSSRSRWEVKREDRNKLLVYILEILVSESEKRAVGESFTSGANEAETPREKNLNFSSRSV